jgi:hypothetical protein
MGITQKIPLLCFDKSRSIYEYIIMKVVLKYARVTIMVFWKTVLHEVIMKNGYIRLPNEYV